MQNEALKEKIEVTVSDENPPQSAAQPPAVASTSTEKESKPPDDDLRNRMMLAILIFVFLGVLPLVSNLNPFDYAKQKSIMGMRANPRVVYYDALMALDDGNWKEAEKLLREYLHNTRGLDTPSQAAATENLARACFKQNKLKEAARLVDAQARLWQMYDPGAGSWAAHGQIVKGNFLLQCKDVSGALDAFDYAYTILTSSGERTKNMELRRSNLAQAYKNILELDPGQSSPELLSRIDTLERPALPPVYWQYKPHQHYVHVERKKDAITPNSKSSPLE